VLARAADNDELAGMGTTMTAVTVTVGNHLLIGHVGDSRAYLLRRNEMVRVTEDHSLVEELVREGRLTPEQAEAHPQRAIVTRALGVDADVEVDTYEITVEPGDRVLICSDGLTTMVRERDIERFARSERDPQRADELLVAAANEAGGEDNITVIVIDVLDVAAPTADGAAAAARPEQPTTIASAAPAPPVQAAPRARRSRIRTIRGALLVALPLVVILGVAAGVLGWYARGSYFVGASSNEVVIYKGVPGGVLGWNPTVDQRTGIQVDALQPLDQDRVRTNSTRGSLSTVRAFVDQLQSSVTSTSTTTTTQPKPKPRTTTTRPRPRTTTTRKLP
jgi:protein phosphatase